jgi:hypothetical protein
MHTILPPPGLVYSDVRQKRDLQQLDVLPNGIKLYRYRYRWSATGEYWRTKLPPSCPRP